MKRIPAFVRLFGLSVLALALSQLPAQAQFPRNPYQMYAQQQVAQQNMYMQQLLNAQNGQVFGTNYGIPIYANSVASYYGSGFNNGPYFNRPFASPIAPAVFGADPSIGLANPYSPAGAGYGFNNPYVPGGGDLYGGYNPYNRFGGGAGFGEGQYLQGSADVMRAYGTVINAQESARLLREQALQAKLDTKKKAFELEMYIKANTPTYTQEQERVAKSTLRRIQTNSLPGEVTNGKSLNYLLDDLRNFPGKKIALEPINLSEGVLTHLNVTRGSHGVGVLRDCDTTRLVWPVGLQMSVAKQKEFDEELKDLVKNAYKGQLDLNTLNSVRKKVNVMGDELGKRVNETSTVPYMDARRFVQEFNDACTALEKGEGPGQAKYQRFIEGGKTVQEVVDYMVQNGLRFSAATANDEAAYRSVHSALANYDIAMNLTFGVQNKDQ